MLSVEKNHLLKTTTTTTTTTTVTIENDVVECFEKNTDVVLAVCLTAFRALTSGSSISRPICCQTIQIQSFIFSD